ncbi:ABC transporter permease subunit [Embleya sp. NPDC001921]
MIWVTWRQFRAPALSLLSGCAAYALVLCFVGYAMRHTYNTEILDCRPTDGCLLDDAKSAFLRKYASTVNAAGVFLLLLPAVIGAFWGAPILAREFETGTQRLAWTQSVTRRRWLAVKLLLPGLSALVLTAALSLLLTWAASRYDLVEDKRFAALSFASRNVVPVGYALFAFVVGTTAGLFLRRTVPAMAVTLVVVGAVLLLVPGLVRPHLRPPATVSVPFDDRNADVSFGHDRPAVVTGYEVPGALMLSQTSNLRTESGHIVYPSMVADCLDLALQSIAESEGPGAVHECLAAKRLHFDVTLQPADRYWSFQWIELGGYLILTAGLGSLAYWRVKHMRA